MYKYNKTVLLALISILAFSLTLISLNSVKGAEVKTKQGMAKSGNLEEGVLVVTTDKYSNKEFYSPVTDIATGYISIITEEDTIYENKYHIFSTPTGKEFAYRLQSGDTILTEKGNEKVLSVKNAYKIKTRDGKPLYKLRDEAVSYSLGGAGDYGGYAPGTEDDETDAHEPPEHVDKPASSKW